MIPVHKEKAKLTFQGTGMSNNNLKKRAMTTLQMPVNASKKREKNIADRIIYPLWKFILKKLYKT